MGREKVWEKKDDLMFLLFRFPANNELTLIPDRHHIVKTTKSSFIFW